MRMLAVSLVLALAACGTPQMTPAAVPPVDIQHSTVTVHVECAAKNNLGPEPEYEASDEALKALPFPMAMSEMEWIADWFYQTKLLTADRLQRIKRDKEKTSVLEGC